ncbi:MAG: GNAT family N-acetyltransferase [Alphaproteobacteria bacterium]|nr:MAG: GNAT family N-acetyltransferase [Alphaproteobacteria bacterium]
MSSEIFTEDEFYGLPDLIAVSRRAGTLWRLLRDDPRFAYYGRTVATSYPGPDTADILESLARLLGAGACYFYPCDDVSILFDDLKARGLETDRHEHFMGGEAMHRECSRMVREQRLPSDLTLVRLDAASPQSLVRDTAALSQSCDVTPVRGNIMRGQDIRGICLSAVDGGGRPVATASSYMLHHPESSHATDAFWGMLATAEDRRGEGIAALLGAHALVHMWETHGARGFMTGIRADNDPSQRLCRRMGMDETEWAYAVCLDPTLMAGGRLTK